MTATTTAVPVPGERIIRTHTLTGQSDLTVPSWAAGKLAAEKATEPGVTLTEVIAPGGTVTTSTALADAVPGVTPLSTAELAYLDALLFCTVCRCSHLPSEACPGPCPEPQCLAPAGQSCKPDCPSRFENPGE